jgi:hypothetical protein
MNVFHGFFQRGMGGERTVAPYPYQSKFATQATLPHLLRVPTRCRQDGDGHSRLVVPLADAAQTNTVSARVLPADDGAGRAIPAGSTRKIGVATYQTALPDERLLQERLRRLPVPKELLE